MGILNKIKLACFIINTYKNSFSDKEISPIKLQKSLYLLFAMWGGKVADSQDKENGNTEADDRYKNYNRFLFEPDFYAWKYGPVDKEIYDMFKSGTLQMKADNNCDQDLFENPEITYINEVKDYIAELLPRIFKVSDFGLVDITHEDSSWKNAVNTRDQKMDPEAIIRDYQVVRQ